MRAERFGSYSIEKTLAGTPNLLRLKSIRRYWRFTPPPRWRDVMRPWLLRPPVELSLRTSDFSGRERVISSKVETDIPRRPGDVGLYVRIGICCSSRGLRLGRYACSAGMVWPSASVTMAFFQGRASFRR